MINKDGVRREREEGGRKEGPTLETDHYPHRSGSSSEPNVFVIKMVTTLEAEMFFQILHFILQKKQKKKLPSFRRRH